MFITKLARAVSAIALIGTVSGVALADSFNIELSEQAVSEAHDGRVILIITPEGETEPRFQVKQSYDAPQIFGVNVEGLRPGASVEIADNTLGFPIDDMSSVPAGDYYVQAVLHKYDTFNLSNGKTVKLPAARGAGQNWRKEPGNVISKPVKVSFDPTRDKTINIKLDSVLPKIAEPEDTKYIRHLKIRSEKLSEFWGTDVFIRGHVLVPEGFDEHTEAQYPLAIFHGHFPADFGGFRTSPPDADLECEYSERFDHPCYNRVEQQEAYDFYKKWTSDDFPRMLIVEIDHSNPYYDDSYAVNSANIGPYGDAITYEFVPALEEKFRGLGEGWSRFVYGGSTGGWEALAVQVKYPDEYNGAFAACPDPIDFRQNMITNIYEEDNAYYTFGTFGGVAKPGKRNFLGHVPYTVAMENQWELVLGDKTRSGAQWDVWEAVYSPNGEDGSPNGYGTSAQVKLIMK